MNARTYLSESAPYSDFNREERSFVAIFYQALVHQQNLQVFLERLGCQLTHEPEYVELYVEWSYLRDLWNLHPTTPERQGLILALLQPTDADLLAAMKPAEFNAHFGATPRPSVRFIQSPATWSIGRFDQMIPDNHEFERTCHFKWAFRVKPDLVIQLGRNTALCVEAKWDSLEGSYPAVASEKAIFARRGLKRAHQLEVQKYLMENLLGFETNFWFLTRHRTETVPHSLAWAPQSLTWKEAFAGLDVSTCLPFVRRWVDALDD